MNNKELQVRACKATKNIRKGLISKEDLKLFMNTDKNTYATQSINDYLFESRGGNDKYCK